MTVLPVSLIIFFCSCSSIEKEGKFLHGAVLDYVADIDEYTFGDSKEFLQRIIIDLNNDGLNDLLISGYYKGAWGNAGGDWEIYYQSEAEAFVKCETRIFMYPDAAVYDAMASQILSYGRMGCCEGSVGFFKISDCDVTLTKKINLKAEAGDAIGQKLDSLFNIEGLEKFRVEKCFLEDVRSLEWE